MHDLCSDDKELTDVLLKKECRNGSKKLALQGHDLRPTMSQNRNGFCFPCPISTVYGMKIILVHIKPRGTDQPKSTLMQQYQGKKRTTAVVLMPEGVFFNDPHEPSRLRTTDNTMGGSPARLSINSCVG